MSALGHIFTAHSLTHGIIGLVLIFAPQVLHDLIPFADVTATFLAKAYGTAMLGTAVTGLMCASLPDILPCKRATAVGLMVYHATIAYCIFEGRKEGAFNYALGTAGIVIHVGFLFAFYVWYKVSASQVKAFTKQQRGGGQKSH